MFDSSSGDNSGDGWGGFGHSATATLAKGQLTVEALRLVQVPGGDS